VKSRPVAEIEAFPMVPVPVLRAARTFRNHFKLSIQNLAPATSVYYTTDGSEPTARSARFTRPFVIDRNTTVKARAIDRNGNRSSVVRGTFHRIPHDWKLTLSSSYSSQYPAGGDSALIDSLRGTTNWSGGAWQGYWEKDLVAVVDLGKVQRVAKVGAGFLQDIGSWIWFPRRVEIEVSVDGRTFTPLAQIIHESGDTAIKDFVQTTTPQNARYVRIRAVNSGKNTWIFADEILIELATTTATQTRNPQRRRANL
jgi:Fn3 associated/F5/8 type C domain